MILSLDPSSSCVGYAVLKGLAAADLIDAGRLTPSMARSMLADLPGDLIKHLRQKELASIWRVHVLVRDVISLITEHHPQAIIIETPSGLTGTGAKRGAAGSLTTYGLAAGAILMAAHLDGRAPVYPVTERQWTRWRGPKFKAQADLPAVYNQYNPASDTGADVSDAILLARWSLIHSVPPLPDPSRLRVPVGG